MQLIQLKETIRIRASKEHEATRLEAGSLLLLMSPTKLYYFNEEKKTLEYTSASILRSKEHTAIPLEVAPGFALATITDTHKKYMSTFKRDKEVTIFMNKQDVLVYSFSLPEYNLALFNKISAPATLDNDLLKYLHTFASLVGLPINRLETEEKTNLYRLTMELE